MLEIAPRIGARAPAFSLMDLEGREFTLEDFPGKPVIINFWTTWCPYCVDEMPLLEALHTGGEVVVIAVNVQEEKEQVQHFISENGYSFPVLLDTRGEVFKAYLVRGFPTTFALDEDGVVSSIWMGALDEEILSRLVGSAAGETSP